MTRTKLLAVGLVLVMLAAGVALREAIQANSRASGAVAANKIVIHQLAVSEAASAKTRISTVSQRCDLTRLILGVLVRVHDPMDAAAFQKSQATCLRQLAQVKMIYADGPQP